MNKNLKKTLLIGTSVGITSYGLTKMIKKLTLMKKKENKLNELLDVDSENKKEAELVNLGTRIQSSLVFDENREDDYLEKIGKIVDFNYITIISSSILNFDAESLRDNDDLVINLLDIFNDSTNSGLTNKKLIKKFKKALESLNATKLDASYFASLYMYAYGYLDKDNLNNSYWLFTTNHVNFVDTPKQVMLLKTED